MHDFKAGDKAKVVGLPEGQLWYNPTTKRADLGNGDIITLDDPPITPPHPFLKSFWKEYLSDKSLVAHHGNGNGWIPIEFIEPYQEDEKICTCNMWTTGCICGVFTSEKEGKDNA